MVQTSCTKMQCLGFSSKRCVGGWLISLNCSSYDGRNSVGTVFLALEEQPTVQRLYFFLIKKVNDPVCDESSLFCMPDWRFFFLLEKAMPFLTPLVLCANDL